MILYALADNHNNFLPAKENRRFMSAEYFWRMSPQPVEQAVPKILNSESKARSLITSIKNKRRIRNYPPIRYRVVELHCEIRKVRVCSKTISKQPRLF